MQLSLESELEQLLNQILKGTIMKVLTCTVNQIHVGEEQIQVSCIKSHGALMAAWSYAFMWTFSTGTGSEIPVQEGNPFQLLHGSAFSID